MKEYESPFVTETGYADNDRITKELIRKVNEYHEKRGYRLNLSLHLWTNETHKSMRRDHGSCYSLISEYLESQVDTPHSRWMAAREEFANGKEDAYHEMLRYVTLDNPPERPESHYRKQPTLSFQQADYWLIWAYGLCALLAVLYILLFGEVLYTLLFG